MFETFLSPDAQWGIEGVGLTDAVRMSGGSLYHPLAFDSVDVTISGHLKSMDGTSLHQLFVTADRATDQAWYAELYDDPGVQRRFSLMYRDMGAYTNVSDVVLPMDVPLDAFTLRMSTDVSTGDASAQLVIGIFTASVSGTFDASVAGADYIRVFVDGYTADIDSFFVVSTANTL